MSPASRPSWTSVRIGIDAASDLDNVGRSGARHFVAGLAGADHVARSQRISALSDETERVVMTRPGFHLAVPVDDLERARAFYGGVLGLEEGRSSADWVDWNFYGHQVVTHAIKEPRGQVGSNPVDGHDVPVPHFGLILTIADFHALAEKLRAAATPFVIEPYLRFEGQPGEQWTMFLLDPAGNALEFKAFRDESQVFAK
jgi:extradiol dioxygenase family protein